MIIPYGHSTATSVQYFWVFNQIYVNLLTKKILKNMI